MVIKESILPGVVGLVIGIVLTAFIAGYSVNSGNRNVMSMMGMDTAKVSSASSHDEMPMSQMTAQLKNKSGDDFDKAFVEMMISHHQGAVEMAELAAGRAKHDEIITLSKDIIFAQNEEIDDMKDWQKNWGYTADEMMQRMH